MNSLEATQEQIERHSQQGEEFNFLEAGVYQLLARLNSAQLFESTWYVKSFCASERRFTNFIHGKV
jgi:hypothetical protein